VKFTDPDDVAAVLKIGDPLPDAPAGGIFEFQPRVWKAMILATMAMRLFRQVESELGAEKAKELFVFVSGPTPRQMREANNMALLLAYHHSKMPMMRFVRQYVRHRGGGDAHILAITKQLKRLLSLDPAKQRTPVRRMLHSAARKMRRDIGSRPGRPKK
jgi:hypothetical protein